MKELYVWRGNNTMHIDIVVIDQTAIIENGIDRVLRAYHLFDQSNDSDRMNLPTRSVPAPDQCWALIDREMFFR